MDLEILKEDFDYENKAMMQTSESQEVFKAGLEALPLLQTSGEALYEEFVNAVKARVKVKGKQLFMPIRLALTGKEHGPELKKIFPIFGMDGVRRRFERALNATV